MKMDLKCHVLSQNQLKSKDEIFFVLQINEQKITKQNLYTLLEKKNLQKTQ